jgi:alkylation response protein AidB-like acyl-CoA dehydrogenase
MRLLPTQEQQEMAGALREMLLKECSPDVLRALWADGSDERLYRALVDFGVLGLTVPEQRGGLGLDERDAVGVLREIGRAGVPGPVVETLAATHVLTIADDPRAGEIAAGDIRVAVGLGPDPLVESADRANLLLLERDGVLHAVPGERVSTVRQESVDGNRRLFTLGWTPEDTTLLATGAAADHLLEQARLRLVLGTAAVLVGLGDRLLELAVAHVRMREQFGSPLGAFQAVKHRLADVAVGVEFTGPVVARAACALVAGSPSTARDVAMAKVFAAEAAERAAYAALQVHGAIGYTREHDLHLFALRAWSLAAAYGTAQEQRERVAAELLDGEPTPRFP